LFSNEKSSLTYYKGFPIIATDRLKECAMEVLLDVVSVKVGSDYALFLEFENGEMRIFNKCASMGSDSIDFNLSLLYRALSHI
jgi:hypothetical protein